MCVGWARHSHVSSQAQRMVGGCGEGLSADCVVVEEGLEGLLGVLGDAGAIPVGCVSSVSLAHVLRCLAMVQGMRQEG